MSSSGLRERKKLKTRWAIQEHALRLFAQQGYDATTIEQIAAAAEISPSTFFRYFPTKEDVVIDDEYDPMLVGLVAAAPEDLGVIEALRLAVTRGLTEMPDQEKRKVLQRTQLQLSVPAVRARMLDNLVGTIAMLAGVIAHRSGRSPDDREVRVMAGALVGAMIPAIFEWVESDGELDLAALVGDALAQVGAGFPDLR
jgi:AcrR family transcriptional regulator